MTRVRIFRAMATRAIGRLFRRSAMRWKSSLSHVRVGAFWAAFDGCPAHQLRSLLGDSAPVHSGVGLVVAWGQRCPAAQLGRSREPPDVADLGHHHCGEDGSDARDHLDGLVAGVISQR